MMLYTSTRNKAVHVSSAQAIAQGISAEGGLFVPEAVSYTHLVVGIPNTGKSSFINRMAGRSRAKVADRPGVTRQNQWFAIGGGIELLDTPGVLWPKFDDPEAVSYTHLIRILCVHRSCRYLPDHAVFRDGGGDR